MTGVNLSPLCALCRQFTTQLLRFDFGPQDEYPAGWVKKSQRQNGAFRAWGAGFNHRASFAALQESATLCSLCDLLLRDFAGPDDVTAGSLQLFPFTELGSNCGTGTFTAVFTDDPQAMEIWTPQPHTFMFACGGVPWRDPLNAKKAMRAVARDGVRALPSDGIRAAASDGWNPDVFETIRAWMAACDEGHPRCEHYHPHPLPTRLIAVGSDDALPHLVLTKDLDPASTDYATLSHCWGGFIANRLTLATLDEKRRGMHLDSLARNFRDTILIARQLGMEYAWIDALCIVQDSPEDWAAEAGQMVNVYAGSRLVITGLESPSSEAGLLHQNRVPEVVLLDGLVVQKRPPLLDELLESCALSRRGWCLQEHLMARRVLHIGRSEVHWECLRRWEHETGWAGGAPETGQDGPGASIYDHSPRSEKDMHLQRVLAADLDNGGGWKGWYAIVEEFSARALTYQSDVFPAVAGVANIFSRLVGGGEASPTAHYTAGLWHADLPDGLLWGSRQVMERMRKAPGFNKCEVLERPETARAPSWSWASVIGSVHFNYNHNPNSRPDQACVVLGVDGPGVGSLIPASLAGATVRIRGFVARCQYIPPPSWESSEYPDPGYNVGSLKLDGEDQWASDCVMDFDRHQQRSCHALLVRWTSTPNTTETASLLILEAADDPGESGVFRRIGVCQARIGDNALAKILTGFDERDIRII